MYSFRCVTVNNEGIRQCASLLQKVHAGSKVLTEKYLKWQYADNPCGKIIGFNAFENEQIAAHYVTQPLVADLFGKETKGLLSLNTATHPDHRGKKLFITLAEMTYKYGIEQGYEFVIGVANAASTPGFLNKLGFQHVAPLDVKIGVGKFRMKKEQIDCCFERRWTKELLQWRLSNPHVTYQNIGDRICAPTGKYGIKVIVGSLDSFLISDITLRKIASLNPLKLYLGLNSNIDWSETKFYKVPEIFKPSPLNLIYKSLTGSKLKLDSLKVKFQAIDFDAY
jgi:hypothetical protein